MPSRSPRRAPDREDQAAGEAKKRLFIGLVMGTSALVCLVLGLSWVIPYVGLRRIHPVGQWLYGGVIFAAVLLVLWSSLGLVLNILLGKTLPFFKRMRGVTIRLLLPLMTLLGRVLGLSKDEVRSSFVKVNNELVSAGLHGYAPEEILLLLPHCLQNDACDVKLATGVRNCNRCGKCPIDGLLSLSAKYGIQLAIATGGTIARRIVVQRRPSLILAVACERDLTSGIQDTYPLPAYGVLNNRPFGPCLNTTVSIHHIEEAVRGFLHPRHLPPSSG